MNDSATEVREIKPSGVRERRRQETYRALTAQARKLTAERGLNGFTVQELCAAVGVSRRTFFNYFATKEDVILGARLTDPLQPFTQAFLDSGPVVAAGSMDQVPLQDAVRTLIIQGFSTMGVPRADMYAFMEIMKAEPALMKRMIESARSRQRRLGELIAEREGTSVDDPLAQTASALASHLMTSAFERFFGHLDGREESQHQSLDEGADTETPAQAQARFADIVTDIFDNAARFFRA
ncbi:MAG: TetR/AcrR family transcriptional regulator [Propionibacteriales bacterium]|nr:TetR/AcrR family transcriptional regulator [Propionibacteriales bacterium]